MSVGLEAVKEGQEFINKNKPDLIINRVPPKSLTEFKQFANEEFSSDYGMALKWLLDFYKGILLTGNERAEAKADEALSQISEMKSVKVEDKDEIIRDVNRNEIGRKRQ